VVGHAVGAPFAVLVPEQLAVSGADLVISITSAGQLRPVADPPYFVLVDRALRDEGTSGHHVPPATWARVPGHLREALEPLLPGLPEPLVLGDAWTTDAPYRETPAAIDAARGLGAGCVEMESAALYSYATALGRDVICLAHVTNTMAVTDDDFEKGADDGVAAALTLTSALLHALRPEHTRPPAGTSATGPRVK